MHKTGSLILFSFSFFYFLQARAQLFIVTYVYKVPEDRIDRYLDIQRRVREIYFRHGCLGYEVFKGDDKRWLEINKFKGRDHYENVKNSVDVDPEIEILWKEFCSIADKEKIVTMRAHSLIRLSVAQRNENLFKKRKYK